MITMAKVREISDSCMHTYIDVYFFRASLLLTCLLALLL